jgi:hypothetical protein
MELNDPGLASLMNPGFRSTSIERRRSSTRASMIDVFLSCAQANIARLIDTTDDLVRIWEPVGSKTRSSARLLLSSLTPKATTANEVPFCRD